MHSIFAYFAVAVLGLLVAYYLTRTPELRHLRVGALPLLQKASSCDPERYET